MKEFKNYYHILGINPSDVSPEGVRRAFRTKVKDIRPDLNTDLETRARFVDLQEARATLEDPVRHILYKMEFDGYLLRQMFTAIATEVSSLEEQAKQLVREAGKLR